jgi:hypothetical protein
MKYSKTTAWVKIKAIFEKELISYWHSPLLFTVLAIFSFFAAIFFINELLAARNA